MDYGTGIIMSVPAHDQRDFEFAEKYNIPIKVVIEPKDYEIYERKGQLPRAYTGEGFLTNSGKFNGMESSKAIKKITEHLKKNKLGKRVINYKIRDWNISRQRYWGTPIPIIHCKKCGLVPVPEKDLPVELPLKVKFSKKGTPPLATNQKFVNVKCPECRGNGRRETDTMTTFVDSSWYYLRYCSPKYKKEIFDKKKVGYWMPVDQYIGGIEHAVGHLMYSRFITRFLRKSGYVKFDEPFMKLLNHGMVNLGGVKMSKSKGNIIDPLDVIKKHGADVLRTYLLFMAQPDSPIEWSGKDIFGIRKFLEKILTFNKLEENKKKRRYMESITQRKIEVVTKHMEGLSFNKALIELMDFFSKIERYPSNYALKVFLQMLSPFAPHTAEEVWNKIGGKKFVTTSNWPIADGKKIDEKVEKEEGLVNKTLSDIFHILKIIKKKPKKIILYVIPLELKIFKDMEQDLSKEFKVGVEIHAVDDKDKYDPENKSKKVKPGRPGIYIE
ncbi:Leucine--tRNA ligase [subsurface metagenome]